MAQIPFAELETRRKPGRPKKDKPHAVPTTQELMLSEQDPGKQATSVKHDAYKLAKLFGRDLLKALRDNDKSRLKDQVIQWGIAADKVLGGTESAGLTLSVPLALVDKLVLALQSKANSTQAIDKPQETS